jgi:hypothetical protein
MWAEQIGNGQELSIIGRRMWGSLLYFINRQAVNKRKDIWQKARSIQAT